MKLRHIVTAIVIVPLILISACAQTTSDDDTPQTEGLFGVKWILESYGPSNNVKDVIKDSRATAVFDEADGQVTGSASCNSYFGGYDVNGSEITVSQLGNTEMYCMEPEGIMDQEQEYLTILHAAESFIVENNTLRINCGGNILLYKSE